MNRLICDPADWPWGCVPVLVFIALWGGGAATLGNWLEPVIGGWLEPSTTVGEVGATLALWAARAAIAIFALWLALVLTPPLAAPALDHLVEAEERELGVPSRRPLSFFKEISCGLRAQAATVAVVTPIVVGLWLVEVVFPLSIILVLPLKLVLMGFATAWSILDYPLTLRGLGFRARFGLLRGHPSAALGFGIAVTVAFWVPCGGVFLLPAAVIGATRLVWAVHREDPAVWPELADRFPAATDSRGSVG